MLTAFLFKAIYEIYCGEEDLVEDMQLVLKTYGDSLQNLKILTEAEVATIACMLINDLT